MEIIRELLISLGLDVDQAKFVEAIGLEKLLEKGAERLVDVLAEIPRVLAEVVRSTADYGDAISDARDRTGETFEQLQQLRYMAGVADLSFEEVEFSLNHLARAMDGARQGSEEHAKAFAKLGVKVTDANGKLRDENSVLEDIAEGLSKLPVGFERSAAAQAVFGRGGTKMLNVFGGGKESIAAFRKEFEELGVGMDDVGIKLAGQLHDNFNRLQLVFEALKREIAGPLIEAIGPLVDELLEWVKANRELIRSRLTQFGHALAGMVRTLVRLFVGLGKVVAWVVDNWKLFAFIGLAILTAIEAQTSALTLLIAEYISAGISAVASAVSAAASWAAAAAPLLLLIALLTLLALAADDVRGFLEGEDSLIGDIGPKWTKFINDFLKPVDGEHWLVATLKQLGRLIFDFQGQWDAFVKDWKYALDQLWQGIPEPIRRILSLQADLITGGAGGVSSAATTSAAASSSSSSMVHVEKIEVVPPMGASPEAYGNSVSQAMEDLFNGKVREAIGGLGGV